MTQPKKWPERAEWARQDAIAAFDTIHKRSREVQKMIADGKALQAMYILTQIADSATAGKEKLTEAKGSK